MKNTKKILAVLLLLVMVICVTAACDNEPVPEQLLGEYYSMSGTTENTLKLEEEWTFTFNYNGESKSGKFSFEENVLSFNFDDKSTATGTLESNAITLQYDNNTLKLLKKVNFNVTFNSNGGSQVATQTVVNGKTASLPTAPTRDGHKFIGWFADAELTSAFDFSKAITSDVTAYALWSKMEFASEFTVSFELNYQGEQAPQSVETLGNKLFELPVVEREGYEFKGWFVSHYQDGAKLSYKFVAGETIVDADTTLFALWQDKSAILQSPVVNVTANQIKWDAVQGAGVSYDVIVTKVGASDTVLESKNLSNTLVAVNFAQEGDYVITVIANKGDSTATTTMYYKHQALARVCDFSVEGNIFKFEGVPGAQKYFVTVVCANDGHLVEKVEVTNYQYDFSACKMGTDGIAFVVTATAQGKAESVSDEFVLPARKLQDPSGFAVDQEQTLTWDAVEGATSYFVWVNCGTEGHHPNSGVEVFEPEFSLKTCDLKDGGIQILVRATANTYLDSFSAEYIWNKTTLSAPSNLQVSNTTLTWDAVTNAQSYQVKVGEQTYTATTNSFDLSALTLTEGSDYQFSVNAVGQNPDQTSVWSDVLTAGYLKMGSQLSYGQNVLSWVDVIGATKYQVALNDLEPVDVLESSCEVSFPSAGEHTLKVRFVKADNTASDWVTLQVTAYELSFDANGGEEIDSLFLAIGDEFALPTAQKLGYTFVGWLLDENAFAQTTFTFEQDTQLTANYLPNEVAVTLNKGQYGVLTQTSYTATYGQSFQLPVPTNSTTEHVFAGWFSEASINSVRYTDSTGKSVVNWNDVQDTELYAVWLTDVLSYTEVTVGTTQGYAVSKGANLVHLVEVTVPATHNGKPVIRVEGNAFLDSTLIRVINLPASILEISGINAFNKSLSLTQVNIATGCADFKSIDGVVYKVDIQTQNLKLAFVPAGIKGELVIPADKQITSIATHAFENSNVTKVVIPASVKTIEGEAFYNAEELAEIEFVAGGTELTIGERAFANTAIASIELPAHLTSIALGRYAISGETILVDMTSATDAFFGCVNLAYISVANGGANYSSQDGVLFNADKSQLLYAPIKFTGEFDVPTNVTTIANGAFFATGITAVTIPNTVATVGEVAFYNCSKLANVSFAANSNENVTIGTYAFRDCALLATLTFGQNSKIQTIGVGAFMNCVALEEVPISQFTTSIMDKAFYNCSSLTSVVFSDVEIEGNELVLGSDVFTGANITAITLTKSVLEVPAIFAGNKNLTAINVVADHPTLMSIDGVLFSKNDSGNAETLLVYPAAKAGAYVIPDGVTAIAEKAFMGHENITSVTIPASVTYIGDYAFAGASEGFTEVNVYYSYTSQLTEILFTGTPAEGAELTIGKYAFYDLCVPSITLPSHTKVLGEGAFVRAMRNEYDPFEITLNEGLTTIGDRAFWVTPKLKSIHIPSTVKTIGDLAFFRDAELTTVTFAENSQLESIGEFAFYYTFVETMQIPASVKTIGAYAFAAYNEGSSWYPDYVGVKAVTFEEGSQLKTIGARAFYNSPITSIVIPNTVEEIGGEAFYYSSLTSVVFADGGTAPLVIGATATYNYDTYSSVDVGSITGNVFYNLTNLATLHLPARLTEVKENSFNNAGTSSMAFTYGAECEEKKLVAVGDRAFDNFKGTGDLVLPNTLTTVGVSAFSGAEFTTITIQDGGSASLTIGDRAFAYSSYTEINLPSNLASVTDGETTIPALGKDVFLSCTSLKNINIAEGCEEYATVSGMLFTGDKSALILCPTANETEVLIIPNTVTKIEANAFLGNSSITSVTFEAGSVLQEIGASAFQQTNIASVVLPSSLTTLGNNTFSNCSELTSITLSASLTNFNKDMVGYCPKLQSINVESGNENYVSDNGVLYTADYSTLIAYPSAKADESYTVNANTLVIGEGAFQDNKAIKSIVLPNGLTTIGKLAFAGATALESIEIPASVTSLGYGAFSVASSLSTVTFATAEGAPSLEIGDNAFATTSKLTAITLPARLISIGARAFENSALATLSYDEGIELTSIGEAAFTKTKLVDVTLPKVTTLGDKVFYACSALKSVVFAEGLESIGKQTFGECSVLESVSFPASLSTMGESTFYAYSTGISTLTSVTFAEGSLLEEIPADTFHKAGLTTFAIPTKVTAIGDSAFMSSKLQTLSIPDSVLTIGDYAFASCANLTSVTIPASVTSLGADAFEECTSLTTVDFKAMVSEIPDYAFADTAITTFHITASVATISSSAFNDAPLASFTVDENNVLYSEVGGVLYNKAGDTILLCPSGFTGVYTVPASVTTIGEDAFSSIQGLTGVQFAEGSQLETIGAFAFYSTPLQTLVLPNSLKVIDDEAFEYCENLLSVTLGTGLEEINYDAFYGCDAMLEVVNLSSLEIEVGSSNYGRVAYYAQAVFTDGSSRLTVEGDFVTMEMSNDYSEGKFVVAYNGTSKDIVVPNGIVGISANVFASKELTSISLPEGLEFIGESAFEYVKGLTEIILPSTLLYVDRYGCAFSDTVTIFAKCEDYSEDWPDPNSYGGWTTEDCVIIWAYTGEEITYILNANGAEQTVENPTSAVLITLPADLTKSGFYFGGWYTTADFQGEPVSSKYYSATETNLYLRWLTEEEYLAQFAGTSFDFAVNMQYGGSYTAKVSPESKSYYFKFTALHAGTYNLIFTNPTTSLSIYLYQEDETYMGWKYDGYISTYNSSNSYSMEMTAGQTYYVEITSYYVYYEESVDVTFESSTVTYIFMPVENLTSPGSISSAKALTAEEIAEKTAVLNGFAAEAGITKVFEGWYTTQDYQGEPISEGFYALSTCFLYAKWVDATTVTYTFVSNGANETLEAISSANGITLPTVTKEGYTFLGWYTTEDFSGSAITGENFTSETDVTLYAKWEQDSTGGGEGGGESGGEGTADGSSMENAIEMAFDEDLFSAQTLEFTEAGQSIWFKVTWDPAWTEDYYAIYIYEAYWNDDDDSEVLYASYESDGETAHCEPTGGYIDFYIEYPEGGADYYIVITAPEAGALVADFYIC